MGASHTGANIQILRLLSITYCLKACHLTSAVDGKQGGGGGVSHRGEHLDT